MPPVIFSTPDSSRIKQIFTEITPRYDLLNGLLSMSLDRAWRRWAVKMTLEGGEKSILDIGTGTGKFLKAFLEKGNFEKIALFFFIPFIIEVILKSRGKLIKSSFGKPEKDGSLSLAYEKLYGLTHVSIYLLKKIGIKSVNA